RGHNARSVGIELVNRGRWPDWLAVAHQAMDEPYPDAQVEALLALLGHLRATLPALRHIAGHEDLDTERVPASDAPAVTLARKRVRGPLLPWPRVLAGCGRRRVPGTGPARGGPYNRGRFPAGPAMDSPVSELIDLLSLERLEED